MAVARWRNLTFMSQSAVTCSLERVAGMRMGVSSSRTELLADR